MAFGVGKSGTCTPKNVIFAVFKANSEGEMPCSFLQNGGFGRGSLNNICIASYGGGAKNFTTNFNGTLNSPTDCTLSFVGNGDVLPRMPRNTRKLLAEKSLPQMTQMRTDVRTTSVDSVNSVGTKRTLSICADL